jgi:hypothetical protein
MQNSKKRQLSVGSLSQADCCAAQSRLWAQVAQVLQSPLPSQAPPPLELLEDELLDEEELLEDELLDDELLDEEELLLDDEAPLELLLEELASVVVSGLPPVPVSDEVVPPLWVPVLPAPPAPVIPGSLKPLAQPDEEASARRQSEAGASKTKVERRMMSPRRCPAAVALRSPGHCRMFSQRGAARTCLAGDCARITLRHRSARTPHGSLAPHRIDRRTQALRAKELPFCPPAF